MTTPRSSFVVSPKRAVQCGVLTFAALAAPRIVAEVVLNGVEAPASDNVLAYIDLDEEPCDAPERRVRQLYQAARGDAMEALQALGYYAPRISTELAFEPDCWRATFTIELGEPVLIRKLDVAVVGEGANDPAFATALADAGLAAGVQLNHGNYERLKRRWFDIAAERGYAEGRLSANRIDVFPEERAADIALRFDSGPRYRFGPVAFEQDVLEGLARRRLCEVSARRSVRQRSADTLYVDLADSGYFQVIDVRPLQPDSSTRQIPIRIVLTGAPRRLITYGIGYSTDTGPRFSLSRNNRRWNDRGHQWGVKAQLSAVISEVTANYRFPFGDPGEEWIGFDVGAKTEDTESAESDELRDRCAAGRADAQRLDAHADAQLARRGLR